MMTFLSSLLLVSATALADGAGTILAFKTDIDGLHLGK